jgi:hypothetical protein
MRNLKKAARTIKNSRHSEIGSRSSTTRFRRGRLRVEQLEGRIVPSTLDKIVIPPATVPSSLGVTYTGMSEQAHGVGLNTQPPNQHDTGITAPAVTMADLEAYLKQLKADYQNRPAGTPAQGPLSPSLYVNPASSGIGADDPKGELQAKYGPNVFSVDNRIEALAHDPRLTGLSVPPLAPSVLVGFDGMNFLDSVNGYVPPDTDIAVGPKYVIETVNAQIQFYDKTTGAALLGNTPLFTFFNAPSESPFDPVVTYDELASRFIVAAPTFSNHMLLAVSKDSNPFDGFSTYDLDISEGGNFPDYTKIGWNADEVVITFNMYPGPTPFHVQILAFAASSIFTNPPSLTLGTDYFSNDRTTNASGFADFTMAAATMHGATSGMPMYFVEENGYGNGSQMDVVSASNLLSSSPSFNDTVVNVDPYTFPPSAAQPGGSIQTNDTRILNAEWRDNILVADQNIGLPADTDAHARWYEFNVSGSPYLVQDGTIAPAPGTSTYFPAISIAPGDVIGMTYNESSSSEYPSVYDTGRSTADPTGTMETTALAHAGTATYSDFAFRWGDYSGIGIDPVDGTFWSGAEYSTATLSGDAANWATWISHFTIAPVVTSSVPAAGSVVTGTAPTTFSLTFSAPIDPGSISASSFTVNGTGADSASLSPDGMTITYTYNNSPVVNQGTESMSLSAGAVTSGGIGNAAFSANFFYVVTQLQVTATSPAVGSVLVTPVTDLVVQFNKDFDPYTVTASDFQVSQGTVVSAKPLTSQAVDLTLSGVTQDGTMTLTLPAGAMLDTFGAPNLAFSGTYIIQVNSQPYPTPLQGLPPAGSLIYDPSVTGAINFAGDTDTYTLPLAANQSLTLVLTVDPSLTGTVTVLDPSSNVVGTATGASAGQTVVLQTAPVATAGTYSLVVSGSGTGNYTLQAILNAVYKQSTDSINTIGTAYDLSSAFASLGTTPAADRAGVVGTINPSANNDYYSFYLNAGQSASLATQGQNGGSASLGLFDSNGNLLAIPSQASLNQPLNFSSGFAGSASQLTFNGFTILNGSNLELTDGGFSEASSAFSTKQVDVSTFSTNFEFQITPGTNPTADGLTFTIQGVGANTLGAGGGGLGYYGMGSSVAIKFDLYNNQGEGTDSTGIYTDGAFPGVPAIDLTGTGIDLHSGDPFNVAMTYDGATLNVTITDTITSASASQSYSINIPGTIGGNQAYVGFTAGTGALTAVQQILNWTFTPPAGISAAKFESINNFVAPTAGTYYAQVDGAAGTNYDLVVTRGADFDIHGNSFNKAQRLDGASVVLGAITKGTGGLFTLDDQLGFFSNPQNPIWLTDPTTGVFIPPSINAPGSPFNNPFGQNLAFDGTNLYYENGAFFGDGTIYKLDPLTGNVVQQASTSNGFTWTGLAYLNGKLYADAAFDPNIYIYDAASLTFLGTIHTGISDSALTGLCGDPDRGVLWAVGQLNHLYEIDPATGNVIKEGAAQSQGFEQDIAYANGNLYVSDSIFFGSGGSELDVYNPDTFALLTRLPVATLGYVAGVGGDGLGGVTKDWYQFNVNAGDNLVITTTTPGGTSGNGFQFINDLNPTINLYDDAGNLVATATGNASDGRNDVINWTALTTGSYRVQIEGATKDSLGEYTIAIQGATGGQYPFTVTSTSPVGADSDVNFQPATLTVGFNDSILLTSVNPADLTIDGSNATAVTVVDSHTLSFTLPAITDGTHNVSIAGVIDIHGISLTPDSFSFITDTDAPFIVSSTIADGSVFTGAQSITDVITFSEPMNTSLTPSLDLFGEVRNIHYAASSATYDPTGTVLTIVYNNLPTDAYQFNLTTSGFQDPAGNVLASGLTTNFTIVAGTSDITGLTPILPLGSLVYQATVDNVVVNSSDVDTYNLTIDPHQTLSVIVRPVSASMTATVNLIAPDGTVTSTVSPSPGAPAVIPAVQSPNGGTYQFTVTGGPGEYTIQPILNALVDPAAFGGPPDGTIATAQPIDPYANRFVGHNDRVAVLGTISGVPATFGDALVVETGFSGDVVLINQTSGNVVKHFNSPAFSGLYLFDVKLATDNTFYVLGDLNFFTAEIIHMDLQGNTLGTIISPVTDSPGFLSPEGFAVDPRDGSFWIPLVNSGNLLHLSSTGTLLSENFVGSNPDGAAVGPDGKIYISLVFSAEVESFDPTTLTTAFFASSSFPLDLTWSAAGDLWVGDLFGGAEEFNTAGVLLLSIPSSGVTAAEPALSGNIWDTNVFFGQVNQYTSAASLLTTTSLPLFQPGLAVLGDVPGEAPLPLPNFPVYSFALNAGQSATLALESLNQTNVGFTLFDNSGNVMAFSSPGATNYSAGVNNFVARADGTYYVQVTGEPGAQFNLVVTRGADFTTQDHTSAKTSQDITPTQQSGDSQQGGALGYLVNPSGAQVSSTIEGIDFNGSNCGCLPPDTNAAVGDGFIVETVNIQFRIYDTAGNIKLDEPLNTLFAPLGVPTAGDPYVVFDTIANRWYVDAIDGNDLSKLELAISNDANPLDGFTDQYLVPLAASGDLADFPKFGYNHDAIVFEANDFGDGHSVVTAVDKAQALSGTLVFYQSTPAFQFRALVPAQMHGSNPGDPMWFMAATGDPTYDGTHPKTIRVTRMDNVLSNSPVYTDYTVGVNEYGPNSGVANQPGGTVATNDVTATQVDYLNGELVTAFSASTPADGFNTTKAHWYQVDVSGATPTLVQEGLIDPGPGVATFFPSATQDAAGNIGITYMESSATEFVSAYVAGHIAGTPLGTTTAGTVFAPGGGLEFVSFRNGDYSSVVLDPTDGKTFWAANEYVGADGSSDIWRTKIASFTMFSAVGTDYYSVNANAGDSLHFATSTPPEDTNDPSDPADEFVNNLYPALRLYDNNGNLVATADGNAADGRNSFIDLTVPEGGSGTWMIVVTASANTPKPTQGEYGLLATGATGGLSPIQVTSTNPADGALLQPPTDYIVTFNHAVFAPSLTPGELTINGVAATAVTLRDAHTVDWTIDPASIPSGERVLDTAVISADPGTGSRVEDVSGAQLADFTSTFVTDNVPPSVVSSSVNPGDVFSPAPYNLTEVVTFSEPMNTALTTLSSFDLLGIYRNQHIAAASFSWDATGTMLTINYANLPDDSYTLTLFASSFQDLVGLPLASDYTLNFAVALGTVALPTPLTPVPPLGDLIYTGSDSHVLVTSTDVDGLTIALNAGETLTVIGTPTSSAQQLAVTVLDPNNNNNGNATAPAAGQNVYLQTVPAALNGTYTIQFSDALGTLGLYDIQIYLNSLVKVGTSNLSIATAQDLTSSSFVQGPGNADRLAVVGSLPAGVLHTGDAFVAARYEIFYDGTPEILRVDAAGNVVQKIAVSDPLASLAGVELSPYNNELYAAVTTSFNASSVSGELVEFDPTTGAQIGVITLPDDPADNFFYYPFGFAAAADGTFWVPQPNSHNILHVDGSGTLLGAFSTGTTTPESATIRADGNVYFAGFDPSGNGIYLLNTTTLAASLFASEPNPDMTKIAASDPSGSGVWAGDFFNGAQRFDQNGTSQQGVGYYGSIQAQTDGTTTANNVWVSNFNDWILFRFDQFGNQQLATFAPGALGVSVWGVDNPNPPAQDTQDYYSFNLTAGQSATIAVESLNSLGAHVTLVDGNGNVLATGVGGSSNVSEYIQNFVAGSTATYYAEVTGDPGVKYSLTVTRGANFDIEPHNTIYTAQPLTGTNGVLGALDPGGTLVVHSQIEGIDFNGSNCGCLPPDTNAAVGGNYVVENVNVQFRVYDKTTGSILLDEPFTTFFGASSGGDPYVVYDDIANRWYDVAFNSSDSGFFLNVSIDSSPLDGFTTYQLTNGIGGAPDYPKMGFNKDAIFVSYNDFSGSGGGGATVISIDKNAILSGTLSYFVSKPPVFQFRAMPPAQMHGDTTGGVEWFVSTDGTDTGGTTIRVTELTNYLSNSPMYTLTSLPVAQYAQAFVANQPGGSWTTFPNTTTTQVQYRNGKLVTAMASAIAVDGFTFPKGLYYEVDVSGGSPTLVLQGVIDPGAGVAVQMPTVAIDNKGNLGFTWMEGSSSEFVSMWIGSLDTLGHFSSFDAAPGGGFFYVSFRIGDYSSTVVDPTDGTTFWSANEYSGADAISDIWRTHITSFSLPPAVNNDWYSINVAAGNSLSLQSYTPSDQGGQFPNNTSVNLELYDTFGNLVATGTVLADGRNESLFYNAPITGQYRVHVFNNPGSSGEYFLSVNTASYAAGDISGQVYNDLNGSGSLVAGDPGLDNWEIDLFSKKNFIASQLSHGGGNFDFGGLAPGTYTVREILQAGWTETQPTAPSFTYTVTVTAGTNSSGWNFGNFLNITISGEKFNDLTGAAVFLPGDPGLQGWTIDLVNAKGKIVQQQVTGMDGSYTFTDVGPGTYTVQEELQTGWIQTFPAPPGTYTLAATSGGNLSGVNFGNFQLVTFSGTVFNDLNGNGVFDAGEPGLKHWTVNLYDSMGNLVATTKSKPDGSYSFADVGPGIYTIAEVHMDGWYQTEPVDPPGIYTVQAISSTNPSGLDFGNFQLVNVSGEVYNDLNKDGQLDHKEPGLQGWTVTLYDSAGNVVATTTSDVNGDYSFANLFPGTFTMSETLQAGWGQSQPVNPNFYQFTTQSGTDEAGLNFGNYQLATFVSGTVWNDLNDNHVIDSGEPGQSGVPIYVDGVFATNTDTNGNYTVSFFAGTHTITEGIPSGYIETTPGTGVISITTPGGETYTGQNFGNVAITFSVDNGGSNYFETGSGWQTLSAGWNGTSRTHPAVSKGIAATWGFQTSRLPKATYEIYVSFQTDSSRDPNAQYIISDPVSHTQWFVNVNQTVTPANGQYGGVGWYDLGSFPLTVKPNKYPSVRLQVGSGGSVDADGVLWVQLSSGSSPLSPVTLVAGPAPAAPAAADLSSVGNLPAVLSSTHVDGKAVALADTTHGLAPGLAALAGNDSASLVAQPTNYRQAVAVLLGGHAPSRHQLDGLWIGLEIDPVVASLEN